MIVFCPLSVLQPVAESAGGRHVHGHHVPDPVVDGAAHCGHYHHSLSRRGAQETRSVLVRFLCGGLRYSLFCVFFSEVGEKGRWWWWWRR